MRALCAAIVSLAAVSPARASIYDIFGFNARGVGMGGAMTANADDYTGTFYNPAALTRRTTPVFGGGMLVTVPRLDVTRTLPVCLDGTQACGARYGTAWSDRDTVLPEPFVGFVLGWSIPLGGVFKYKLAIGVSLFVPSINLVRGEGLDPQTPQFYMYQNLHDQLVLLVAVAYRPLPWLSFGVGAQILADVHGRAAFTLDILNGTIGRQDLEVELAPKAAATAGLHFRPIPALEIGVSYRQELALEFRLPADFVLSSAASLRLGVDGTLLYTPHTISFGVSYHFEKQRLTLSLAADYALWSLAPDPTVRVSVDIQGELVRTLGLQDTLDISSESAGVDLRFRDTVSPRFGLEWGALPWLDLQLGYFYRPSPASRATGPNNHLDNDVHAFSFGTAFLVNDPFRKGDHPIRIGLSHQLGWLPNRTIHKASAQDPVGDLQHGGLTYALSLSVDYTY